MSKRQSNISTSSSSARKGPALTIREKYDLIQLHEKQNLKPKELMKIYSLGRTQLYQILRDRDKFKKIISEAKLNVNRKKIRMGKNEVINVMVYDWYKTIEKEGTPITGVMIRNKAMEFINILGVEDFKASYGWLNSFINRHGIKLSNEHNAFSENKASATVTTLPPDENLHDSNSDISECNSEDPLSMTTPKYEYDEQQVYDIKSDMTMNDAINSLKQIKLMLECNGKHGIAKKVQDVCDEIANDITYASALEQLDKIHMMLISKGKLKIADKIESIHKDIHEISNE